MKVCPYDNPKVVLDSTFVCLKKSCNLPSSDEQEYTVHNMLFFKTQSSNTKEISRKFQSKLISRR